MADALMATASFVPFADGLDHPEGVAWGLDGFVYAGGEAGQVYRVDLASGASEQIACTGGFTLGVASDAAGNLYTCNQYLHAIMRVAPGGAFAVYSDGSAGRKLRTPNYPVFDPTGNLYVSDSGDFGQNNGCLFRIRPGGVAEVVSDSLVAFPNGMALNRSRDELYVVLSTWPGVVKVTLQADGAVGRPQPVVHLPGTVPDGLAFDAQDNLYISCYAPSHIYRLAPDGALALLAADWTNLTLSAPTNLAFCGPDLRVLVTAGLSRWHLTRAPMDVPGLPLVYPRL